MDRIEIRLKDLLEIIMPDVMIDLGRICADRRHFFYGKKLDLYEDDDWDELKNEKVFTFIIGLGYAEIKLYKERTLL